MLSACLIASLVAVCGLTLLPAGQRGFQSSPGKAHAGPGALAGLEHR
jgi:hypothetical protein